MLKMLLSFKNIFVFISSNRIMNLIENPIIPDHIPNNMYINPMFL